MIERTGIPTPELIAGVTPSEARRRQGPVAVAECFQPIPCNPCSVSCPVGAIKPMLDINALPEVDFALCTGCGLCLGRCPGLAIFIIDESLEGDRAIVRLPYEFVPLPQAGESVTALDRAGEPVCRAEVYRVQEGAGRNRTSVVWLLVPRERAMDVRFFQKEGPYSDDTMICRCEELTLGELRERIRRGMHSVDEIKRSSRAGMGPCQGRTCRPLILQELSRATGRPMAELEVPTFRPPITPVRLGMLLEEE